MVSIAVQVRPSFENHAAVPGVLPSAYRPNATVPAGPEATMPADAPGSLKPAEIADVIAFILKKDSMPAGETELPADPSTLKAIKLVAPKP